MRFLFKYLICYFIKCAKCFFVIVCSILEHIRQGLKNIKSRIKNIKLCKILGLFFSADGD